MVVDESGLEFGISRPGGTHHGDDAVVGIHLRWRGLFLAKVGLGEACFAQRVARPCHPAAPVLAWVLVLDCRATVWSI